MADKPYLIGISGGSAGGKSTVAALFLKLLGKENSVRLCLDNYYRDISYHKCPEGEINFDSPTSIELELFEKQLTELKSGKSIDCPLYDFTTHTRQKETITILPKKFIVVEGLFLFNQMDLGDLFDLKLYITAPDDIRLIRRIKRDIKERGRSLDSVLEQYNASVRPMHIKQIEPNRELADIVIDTYSHSFSEVEKQVKQLLEKVKC